MIEAFIIEEIKNFYQKWQSDSAAKDREIASLKNENALKAKELQTLKHRMDRLEKLFRKK